MTVQQAIAKAKALINTETNDETLVAWLSNLDGRIFNDHVSWHEDADTVSHGPYTTADMDTELLVPAPYDYDVYVEYLKARINQDLSETVKANNGMILHNAALSEYAAWYNRTQTPKQTYYIKGCTI